MTAEPPARPRRDRRWAVAVAVALLALAVATVAVVRGPLSLWPWGWGAGERPPEALPAEEAARGIAVPAGFSVRLFAAEPQVTNPVALHVDDRGRVLVAETYAFEWHGVFSDDDIACRTPADAARLRRTHPRPHPTGRSERLIRLEDRSGAGRVDTVVTLADGFDLSSGVAAGVVSRGDRVWFCDSPDLWRLTDAGSEADGTAPRERLLSGLGLRTANIGHDLAAGVFGPDGRLYLSVGDRGCHVVTAEGATVAVPDCGAVLRCRPDGTGLEVFATGLRNPHDLAFDADGNLWTCDNDANLGDRSRWTLVMPGADYGWRVGYQSMAHPPWMTEALWDPATVAPFRVPAVGLAGRGPAGLLYCPGTGLPESLAGRFLLCDFPGRILSVGVRPKGAGFELAGVEDFASPVNATDIAIAPGGDLFVSDWGVPDAGRVFGYGRIFRIGHAGVAASPAAVRTARLLAEGMAARPPLELIDLLAEPDLRVRQGAQFELAERALRGDGEAASALRAGLSTDRPSRVRIHCVRGLGQLAERDPAAVAPLVALLSDAEADAEVRAQAARTLGDARHTAAREALARRMSADPSPRVRMLSAEALGRLGDPRSAPALAEALRGPDGGDPFLFHAAAIALSSPARSDGAALGPMIRDASPTVRTAALVALRRRRDDRIAAMLDDPDPAIAFEAARAITDEPVESAEPALAARAWPPRFPPKAARRVAAAALRVGTPEAAESLARLAADPSAEASVRVAALAALGDWPKAEGRDRLTGCWRPRPAHPVATAAEALRPRLAALMAGAPPEVLSAAVRAAGSLGVLPSGEGLVALLSDARVEPAVRAGVLAALADAKDDGLPAAVSAALTRPEPIVRAAAVRLLGRAGRPDPGGEAAALAAGDQPPPVRQAAVAVLGELASSSADDALARLLDDAAAGRLPGFLSLELSESAARRKSASSAVAAKLSAWEAARAARTAGDRLAPWLDALEGGDAAAGRRAFHTDADAACLRCHKVAGAGGEVGPDLSAVGSRLDRRAILESIVFPNAALAPGYDQALVRLSDETTAVGRVERETPTELVLIQPDGTRRTLAKAEIVARTRGLSAMPEGLAAKMPRRRLRDLVEYLAVLRNP